MNIKKKEQENHFKTKLGAQFGKKQQQQQIQIKISKKEEETHLNKAIMENKSQECRSDIGPDFVQPPNHCPNDLLCWWA